MSQITLTRCTGERVILTLPDGQELAVEVREIRNGSVRLRIDADRSIPIFREEMIRPLDTWPKGKWYPNREDWQCACKSKYKHPAARRYCHDCQHRRPK